MMTRLSIILKELHFQHPSSWCSVYAELVYTRQQEELTERLEKQPIVGWAGSASTCWKHAREPAREFGCFSREG